jgi:hypothetical protein
MPLSTEWREDKGLLDSMEQFLGSVTGRFPMEREFTEESGVRDVNDSDELLSWGALAFRRDEMVPFSNNGTFPLFPSDRRVVETQLRPRNRLSE